MQKNCSKKLIGLGYIIPLLFLVSFSYLSKRFSVSAADGINEEINLQGKLVDSDGTNFSGACGSSCNFRFTIYETCSGTPNQVWQEPQSGVSVTDGIFNAKLGSSTSLSSIDFNDNDMCLRVELDADDAGGTYEENFGTVPLNSVPTAFNSKYLAGQAGSSYLRSNASDNYTSGTLTLDAGTTLDINGDLTVSDQTAVFDAASYTDFDLTGDLRILATGDDDDYIYFYTDTDVAGIFWEGTGAGNDPGIYTSATQLGYRDEGGSWASFDSLGGGDNYQYWTLAGSGGTPQTISSTNTATFAGGTGITTSAAATDTLNISFDCSEVEGTDIDCSGESITLESTLDVVSTLSPSGNLNLQADNDADDYIYIDTTGDVSSIFWYGTGAGTDPGIYTTGTELGYRDEGGSWVSFDSLISLWTDGGSYLEPSSSESIHLDDEDYIGIDSSNERIIFDTAGNISVMGANLGIGTTPSYLLHVYNNAVSSGTELLRIGNLSDSSRFYVDDYGSVYADNWVAANSGLYDFSGDLRISGEDNVYIAMDYNSNDADTRAIMFGKNDEGGDPSWAELMRIDETGYVGVGVTDPSALLDIGASTTSRASLQIVTGTAPSSPNTGDMYVASGNLYFYNGASWDDLTSTVGAGSVGTGELKTATSNTSGTINGGGGVVNVVMNDYSFSPNIGVSGATIIVEAYTSQVSDTVGRFRITNSGVPNRTYDVRWRYVTASHDPEIFTWYDTANNIITSIYQAEIEIPQTLPLDLDPIPPNWIPIQATIYEDSLSKLGDDNQTTYIMKNYRFKSYAKASDLSESDPLKASPVKPDTVFITHPEIYYGELEYCGQTCADKWEEIYEDKDLGPSEEAGGDIAEYYDGQDDIQAGDIVSADQTQSFFLTKSIKEYDSKALGIISTSPGQVIGDNQIGDIKLSLTGRVPVKVSNINGPINSGDPITSSHIPATGMKATKAGQIVAKALEAFNPDQADPCPDNPEYKCGKILAFINIGWYEPQGYLDNLDKIISDYNSLIDSTGSIDVLENLTITNTLTANAIQSQDGLFSNIQVDDAMISNNLTVNGLLTSKQIKAGALEAFDSENIIIKLTESLGQTAFVIENSLGESVFSVDSAGKINIKSDTEDASVGSGTLSIGETEIQISTTAVTQDSKIFVSPRSNIGNTPLFVEEVEDGKFKVKMDSPKDYAIQFDWWVIN